MNEPTIPVLRVTRDQHGGWVAATPTGERIREDALQPVPHEDDAERIPGAHYPGFNARLGKVAFTY